MRPAAAVFAALLGATLPAGAPPATRASESDAKVILPDRTLAAASADLDADGTDELVRLVGGGRRLAVEAWGHDGDWRLLTSERLPVPTVDLDPTVGEFLGAWGADVLPVRVGGRERVLVLRSGVVVNGQYVDSCCLTVHEVRSAGSGIEIAPLALDAEVAAATARRLDLDADGTDELALVGTRSGAAEPGIDNQTSLLRVVRREGDAWRTILERAEVANGYGISVGETDGRPGDDLLVEAASTGTLHRYSRGGRDGLSEEAATLPPGEGGSWIAGIADGGIVSVGERGIAVRRWATGDAPRIVARQTVAGWPSVAVLGEGADALVLMASSRGLFGLPSETEVYDGDLASLGSVPPSADAARLGDIVQELLQSGSYAMERNLWPATTLVPGGWTDGRPAFLANGHLIRSDGSGGFLAEPMPALLSQPIGLVGPGDRWLALCDGCHRVEDHAFLDYGPGLGSGTLTLMPLERLRTESAADGVEVAYTGAVALDTDGELTTLLADPGGFEITLEVEPGTSVVTASVLRWEGSFAAELPELQADAEVALFSFDATVTGRVAPGSTVTVDGAPVPVDGRGTFRAIVGAPLWPREVLVVARDPFGAESLARLEVVGLVDYRGLPWAPIVGLLTVGAGIALFVRTPRVRPGVAAAAADGDGRLEEIEID